MVTRGICQYEGQAFHTLKMGNLERELPIVKIDKNTWIASFVMLGDVELVEHCASLLVRRLKPGFEVIVVPEVKALPLAHSIARRMSRPQDYMDYCVIRKSQKVYFGKSISAPVTSITTKGRQRLYLDRESLKKIEGKQVCLIDDVLSTGGTLRTCLDLIKKAGGIINQVGVVLLEGNPGIGELNLPRSRPLVYLGRIPLYVNSATLDNRRSYRHE